MKSLMVGLLEEVRGWLFNSSGEYREVDNDSTLPLLVRLLSIDYSCGTTKCSITLVKTEQKQPSLSSSHGTSWAKKFTNSTFRALCVN